MLCKYTGRLVQCTYICTQVAGYNVHMYVCTQVAESVHVHTVDLEILTVIKFGGLPENWPKGIIGRI